MRTFSRIAGLTLLLALSAVLPALAQPQVAYIIPDIGAPGMNTYVEFIAPFGGIILSGGGLFVNSGNESISIQPDNIADTSRIIVGPIVVSWNGRLASTQIFVKPGAATGTVPLRVTTGGPGGQSTTVSFEIVAPQTLGAGGRLTGGGVLGSGGQFGTRSKRGAMIVDSLSLENGVYTVSTADCDPSTPGEQGYLPFILIAKRGIRIAGSVPTSINVNATGIDGGPGGGGGGGEVCDQTFLGDGGPGSVGGKGYTGGGGGGRNNGGSSTQQQPGAGTGNTAPAALNSATGGGNSYNSSNPETAGGGTGHPFGTGGRGSLDGGARAGNGGGGGNSDGQAGGSAGYGGAGNGSNAGLVHGNLQLVPLAGGSGGASGDPNDFRGRCGGTGGGGGGAAGIFAMSRFDNLDAVTAGGAASVLRANATPEGGGGSGGGIVIGERNRFGVPGALDARGGGGTIPGGSGRVRYDGFGNTTPGGITASRYIGPSMDPLDTVRSSIFTVSGGYNGNDSIKVYMKVPGAAWFELTGVTRSGVTWSVPVAVAAPGVYAFMVAQQVPNPSTTAFQAEPVFVMSQVGANMVVVDFIPKIDVDSTRLTFGLVACPGDTLYDTLQVGNSGDLALNVTPSITGANSSEFSLVAPTGPFVIQPRDTVPVVVRFVPTSNGAKTADLVLTNNDPRPGKNPTTDTLFGSAQLATRSLTRDTLDFGLICIDSTLTLPDTILYNGAGSVSSVSGGGTRFSFASPPVFPGAAQGTVPFSVSFAPGGTSGAFLDSMLIVTAPCGDTMRLIVRGRANTPSISITPDPLIFGNTRVTSSATLPVTVSNNGTDTAVVLNAFFTFGTPPFTMAASPIGTRIAPGGTASVTIRYAPLAVGTDSAHLCFVLQSGCIDTVCFDVRGNGVNVALGVSRPRLVLRADSCTDTPGPVVDTLKLYNGGGAAEQITGISSARGQFAVTTVPSVPGTIGANDSIAITATWTPGSTGLDTLVITTGSTDPAQQRIVVPVELYRDRAAYNITLSNGDTLPSLLDFGDLFACSPNNNRTFLIRNIGTLNLRVSARMTSGTAFTVIQPAAISVASGATGTFTVVFTPATPGRFDDTLVVVDSSCNREVRLPVTGVGATLTFTTSGINFGTSNVGSTRTGTARLDYQTNPSSSSRAIVDSVAIVPSTGSTFTITSNPTPTNLIPGEGLSVDVGFTPTAQTGFSGQLCFYLSQPCDTIICVPLNGFGVQSNILVRQNSLNYGSLAYCRDSIETVVIVNTGTATLDVTSLLLGGTDQAAFEQVTTLPLPSTINPGDSLVIEYRFVPDRSPGNGVKTATVQVTSNDPVQPVITVNLIGERRRQVLTTPSTLNFGSVEQGTSVEQTITLENRTNEPISVGTLTLGVPFRVEGTLPAGTLPATIAPGDSLRVRVSFTPSDTVVFSDSLRAAVVGPCADTSAALVTGRGFRTQSGGATISIPATLTGVPGDRLSIPILLSDARLLNESGARTVRVTLHFDGTLLVPTRARSKGEAAKSAAAQTGSIISNSLVGHNRVVQIQLQNTPNPTAPDTLGFLDVVVALGDSISTPIVIDTAVWVEGTVTTLTQNGSFALDSICLVGSRRLVRVEGFGIKRVSPNPVRGNATLEIATVESGVTSLRIYDLSGRSVATLLDETSLTPGTHTVEWQTTQLPAGLYQVVLTSPTQRNIVSVVVVR